MQDVPEEKRTARFQCVIVYMRHAHDPTPLICQGTWEGRILFTPQGNFGFGYDPIFLVPERHCSAAQLPADEKNTLSHRAQASAILLSSIKSRL
jgi:XTP/dITP diphosphohydrolase